MHPERKHEPAGCVISALAIFPFNKMTMPSSGSSRRLVQYVIVRSDLIHTLSWPLGAVITQACHAATAAIHLHYSDPDTQEYLAELDSMHKVVLQAPDEASLSALSSTLLEKDIAHKLWMEQPENIPTCLALKPYPKETVQPFLKKLKLFK
ncbi:putative peptidyl-tRNA hydrolase PTRHD1 [Sinocyclocheilus grahami]|uniref:peptidyl-tRNA hydrolase n=1 Tax=Sinocyclocheilus grahami TaxID=75366 RepID=A0A672PSM2_SINGR|nr:PREDICTED: putative peptidyl-tRNA hydrolase PTRHD1 [Sinocyclocheilus grahami]